MSCHRGLTRWLVLGCLRGTSLSQQKRLRENDPRMIAEEKRPTSNRWTYAQLSKPGRAHGLGAYKGSNKREPTRDGTSGLRHRGFQRNSKEVLKKGRSFCTRTPWAILFARNRTCYMGDQVRTTNQLRGPETSNLLAVGVRSINRPHVSGKGAPERRVYHARGGETPWRHLGHENV